MLGVSNIVAHAVSMGFADALSTKVHDAPRPWILDNISCTSNFVCWPLQAKHAAIMKERADLQWELREFKEDVIEEMVEIYMEKGLSRTDSEMTVRLMAKYDEFFVDRTMVRALLQSSIMVTLRLWLGR